MLVTTALATFSRTPHDFAHHRAGVRPARAGDALDLERAAHAGLGGYGVRVADGTLRHFQHPHVDRRAGLVGTAREATNAATLLMRVQEAQRLANDPPVVIPNRQRP